MESQEVDAVPQREDAGLLVQLQTVAAHKHPEVCQQVLQELFRRVDGEEVIHVPAILLDAVLLLDDVVKLIQEQQGEELAGLVAQAVRAVRRIPIVMIF